MVKVAVMAIQFYFMGLLKFLQLVIKYVGELDV